MPFEAPEITWRAIGPALALFSGGALGLVVLSVWRTVSRLVLAGITLVAIGAASWSAFDLRGDRNSLGMEGAVAVDGVSLFATMILLAVAALTVFLSYSYLEGRRIHRAEYYPLLLFATGGMVLLTSANDLLLVFISLEVLSLALYIMAAIARRDRRAQEGAFKYFLLGSFSSAFLLYGVALAYGATGTTKIGEIAQRTAAGGIDERLALTIVALFVIGFGFKVAAVPFHMWTPDVYQGAPTSVTAFMAAGTKTAGFAVLLRVFFVGFGVYQWNWQPVLWAVAALTMLAGALLALWQSDVKRLLAYSSISHAGFVLVGVVAGNADGLAGSLFYLLTYAAMVLGSFGIVIASAPGGRERLAVADWAGLGQRNPVFAGAMTLFLLSLAGIPPTAGFMGKLFVFSAAVQAGEIGLVVVALAATVIAAFFYLRLIVVMWLTEPAGEIPGVGVTPSLGGALVVTAAATIGFGIFPHAIMDLARAASVFTG